MPREGCEAHALAEHIVVGDAHGIEGKLCGVAAPPTHLLQGAGGAVARCARVEEDQGDAGGAFLGGAGAHRGNDDIGAHS